VSDALEYAINSLRRAADSNHEWTLYPAEASALVAEVERLRAQRALDNDALARAWDESRDTERAAVVAYLRFAYLRGAADAIERGEHRQNTDSTPDPL
jgi:hypothetical protein